MFNVLFDLFCLINDFLMNVCFFLLLETNVVETKPVLSVMFCVFAVHDNINGHHYFTILLMSLNAY